MNYQIESAHVADYQLYTLPGIDFTLRGPQWPLEAETPSISFLGAAQVFGAFCKYPFPNLVGEMCSARVFNFGRGGAGPGFYTDKKQIVDYVNNTDACVIQLMSARSSAENSYMTSVEGLTRVRLLSGPDIGKEMLGHVAFNELAKTLPKTEFFNLVIETRKAYVEQFKSLLDMITIPKILLYVGRNPPLPYLAGPEDWEYRDLLGIHPHMVSTDMISDILKHDKKLIAVESYDAAGFDTRIMNRFTGNYVSIKRSETYTVTRHNAYISPELHTSTALKLVPVLKNVLTSSY
ncbi:DUF6473 family protein [Roseibium sp.]|uniref:DUF6473 family protein n=1 Tax=Roseibium sp. TaxID=1936156 RepID=UPI003BABD40E